jgi:hypothetical protein
LEEYIREAPGVLIGTLGEFNEYTTNEMYLWHIKKQNIYLDPGYSIFQFAVPLFAVFADKRAFQKLVYLYL